MTFTRKQKVYGAVLGAAAVVFMWDRAGGGEKPSGSESAFLIHATATPPPGTALAPTPAGAAPGAGKRASVAQRIEQIAATVGADAEHVDSAFAIGAAWLPPKPPQPASIGQPTTTPTIAPGNAFVSRHRLEAVMMRPKGGYAIVDGQGVFVGQRIERFTLESLKRNSAIFVWNNQRVELTIIRPDELMIDGSVISNRDKPVDAEAATDTRPVTSP